MSFLNDFLFNEILNTQFLINIRFQFFNILIKFKTIFNRISNKLFFIIFTIIAF